MKFCLFVLWSCLLPISGIALEDPVLRVPERDAVNAAWLLTFISDAGNSEIPQIPRATSGTSSFDEVIEQCKALGTSTSLRQLNFSELMSLKSPAAVLLRDSQDRGYFSVVVSAENKAITLIDTNLMVISIHSEDGFRSLWTGHALLPVQQEASSFILLGYFAFGAIASLIGYKLLTRRFQTTKEN